MIGRAIFKGSISFGLVNIPIKLYTTTTEERTKLVRLCKDCGSLVGLKNVCKTENKEIAYNTWDRGFEVAPGTFLKVTNEQLEQIALESKSTISILTFIPVEEIEQVWIKDSYYIGDGSEIKKGKVTVKGDAKAYVLLREALKRNNLAAIGKLSIHNRENLVAILAHGKYLLLLRLYFAESVKQFDEEPDAEVSKEEMDIANMLIEKMKAPFNYAEHKDRYEEALRELLSGKQPVIAKVEEKKEGSLAELLKASIPKTG